MNLPHIDRDYPYQIETPPVNDVNRQKAMTDFCLAVNYRMRTEDTRYRWCFPNKALAEWFQSEFGGELFDLSDKTGK